MEADDGPTDLTRASYDAVAEDYAAQFLDELDAKPLDRALLSALIESMAPGTPIADIGCGPGHVTAWLQAQGTTAVGIDLSPRMIDVAQSAFPLVEFRVGDMRELPAHDGEFGAVVALYSIIHIASAELPGAVSEMRRVLLPDGVVLLGFHRGDEVVHRDEWFGHEVSVDFRLLEAVPVEAALVEAGFEIEARLDRVNYPSEHPTKRTYLLARKGD